MNNRLYRLVGRVGCQLHIIYFLIKYFNVQVFLYKILRLLRALTVIFINNNVQFKIKVIKAQALKFKSLISTRFRYIMSFEKSHTYEALDRIGTGAYGTVYRARDKKTGCDVALKKVRVPLSEDGIPMNSLREISVLRQLNAQDHPNIVRLLDVCHGQMVDKALIMYLVFEHVEQDLASYIEKNYRGFTTTEIRNLSKEILCGVDFLHVNRIIHRDLKPQNLLVTHDGHIKLADFGLAKTYDFEMKLTSVVVTLWYRSPEVLLGLPYATPVDIWSIGCIIAELYSLKPLFSGLSEGDQLSKIFRVLGKPVEAEWPKEDVPIKWNSFDVINTITINDVCRNICETAEDLIMKMLTFLPSKRITAADALNHQFFLEEPINT